MARRAKSSGSSSGSQDLIGRISDTIASHSRLSAAAAFQMGVLLGQVMNNTGAMKSLKKTVTAAPGAIASSIPTFGLFESKSPSKKAARRGGRARAKQLKRKARRNDRDA